MSAASLIALVADESSRPTPLAIPILAVVFVAAAAVWFFTRSPSPTGDTTATKADRGGKASTVAGSRAGGDIHIGDRTATYHQSPTPPVSAPNRAERLRRIRDEIGHHERRFEQLEKQREEWGSIWPGSHAPYQRLLADKWNDYGASLNLPQEDHGVVQEAYELANDFNIEMERGPSTFGDREPDLEALREAFGEAKRVIEAATLRDQGDAADPFARAARLARDWHGTELGAALLSIRQELWVNQRRLKKMLARGTSKDFKGFPSAQWTSHEERVRRQAPSVCVLADQAYGLIIEMREAGLEAAQRKLTDDDIGVGQEALALFEQTIAAIDAGQR